MRGLPYWLTSCKSYKYQIPTIYDNSLLQTEEHHFGLLASFLIASQPNCLLSRRRNGNRETGREPEDGDRGAPANAAILRRCVPEEGRRSVQIVPPGDASRARRQAGVRYRRRFLPRDRYCEPAPAPRLLRSDPRR